MSKRKRRIASVKFLLAVFLAVIAVIGDLTTSARAATPQIVTDGLAALDSLLATCVDRDAADDDTANGSRLPYRFCDDGTSAPGVAGVPVPAAYHPDASGNDWSALPAPATMEETLTADARDGIHAEPPGDRVTLDVDISMPPAETVPPPGGFPVLVFLHGGGGNKNQFEAATIDASGYRSTSALNPGASEVWHRSNAWYASRGFVVITYSMRHSVLNGSSATIQVSRRYDANDVQWLAGLVADHDAVRMRKDQAPVLRVDPLGMTATGYSSGSHLTWMLAVDPEWMSPGDHTPLRLAGAVPYAGFTDIAEILAPSGHFFDRDPVTGATRVAPHDPARASSRNPVGVLKQTFLINLLCSGDPGVIFASNFQLGCKRLEAGEPYDPNDPVLKAFYDRTLNDMSAYYQQDFFTRLPYGYRAPVFAIQGWNDQVTPAIEAVRMYNAIKAADPDYPIGMYIGDVAHGVPDKLKEWGDLCGMDRHVCTLDDYSRKNGSLDFDHPRARVREGAASLQDNFLHRAVSASGVGRLGVQATTRACSPTAAEAAAAEPGPGASALGWRGLASVQRVALAGGGTADSRAPDPHGIESDPTTLGERAFNGFAADACYTTTNLDPGPGIAVFRSAPFVQKTTMLGIPTVRLTHAATGADYRIAARLFDLAPTGSMTMLTRGVCRVNVVTAGDTGCSVFDLWGDGHVIEQGHRLVLEVTLADSTFFRRDNLPASLAVTAASIDVPVAH